MNELKMDRNDVFDYARTNKVAMEFLLIATEDYIAARCCFNNNFLSQGFILAEQAVEKMLKSILLFLSLNDNYRKYSSHKIEPIIQRIQELRHLDLTKFQVFAKRLSDIYELSRYPDSKLSKKINSWGMSGDELHLIDKMYFHLQEILPIPDEVKYRSGLYHHLCETSGIMNSKHHYWATFNNKIFQQKKAYISKKYKEIYEHLYSR